MAINEQLTHKIRQAFADTDKVEEKKMFSGIAFMVNGKLCVTVGNNRIMCRINPALHDELVHKPGCTTVLMKGREYRGYVWVNETVLTTKQQISYWVNLALDYNPAAKASARKKSAAKKK